MRSPFFKSNANKYLAYGVVGLSFALLSLALELTENYESNLAVRLIDAFSSGALFPVLILLFIANQVDHPFRHSRKRWLFFVPHLISVTLSLLNIAVDFSTVSVLLNIFIELIDTLLFLFILFFIPGVLLYAYSFLQYASSSEEKKWLTQLWFWVFIIMVSWVASIFFALFSFIDFASMMRTIALGTV